MSSALRYTSAMDHALERLARTVKQAQHRQHRATDAALNAIGTTLVQWDAMRAIATEPGASAHRLALATFQTDQAFGTLANRLEAQGMIERRAGEGRKVEHRLTAAGAEMLAAANLVAERIRKALYADLGKADRLALAALLERILADDKAADLALPGRNKRARAKAAG
jgi:DNA-binding MarR family transcriptional regulator